MSNFEPPWPPAILPEHEAIGDTWAEETDVKSHSKELTDRVKNLYLAGTVIWSAHRSQLLERFEDAGGIKRVNQASLFNGGLNYIELADGSHVYAKDILKTPQQVLSSTTKRTRNFGAAYDQRHTVSVTFGGRSIGVGTSRSDYELDTSPLDLRRLDEILQDETAFPETINLRELLVTTLHKGEDEEAKDTSTLDYVLAATIWGSNFMAEDPMPDPYADYTAYKAWALRGNTMMNVQLAMPVIDRSSGQFQNTGTHQVMDEYGSLKAPVPEVLAHFERFRHLLTFYAFQQYPDLFHGSDPEAFDALPRVKPVLEP